MSTFAPLRRSAFRMLWLAWLGANMTMWMNDVAAAWLMTTLTDNAFMVAMVQTASTLPVFLLGLPSGALADIVDRRRYFALTQVWVCVVAVLLAVLSFTGALSASLLLVLTFANGIGMAMRWPVFAAIVPDLVPGHELPAALALNGVAMNMSRVIGPVAAGALIAGAGSGYVFALNAALAMVSFTLILRWRPAPKVSTLPKERFLAAMRVGLQHVARSPRMRILLMRIFLFFFQATALTALLPLIARGIDGGGPGIFTALLAAMGSGALLMALNLARVRPYIGRDTIVYWGIGVHAVASVSATLSTSLWLALPAMAVAGMAWIAAANSLTVAAQLALPNWVRARGMSIYHMAVMSGGAAGAALWGAVAQVASVSTSVIVASAFGPLLLVLTRRHGAGGDKDVDLSPAAPIGGALPPVFDIAPNTGPIMVTIEYKIPPANLETFTAVMRETRMARLRQGAMTWGLLRDTTEPGRYIEYFLDENWVEHQRRLERLNASDMHLRQRRLDCHVGAEPPRIKRFVSELA
ncbi:MFS transporter [Pseudoduganella umbonata]|uniref:MFS transporter n=1 Tax=Pseudoduganella umbonata TaxID=864828 RepID=A0A4P8HI15_9BURK|nr:MFS transporter [Pseudoduganella umbonata]MBB3221612.1 putative MFS family arabinose efflux permease [Pseudoduganella umbonata]QCP09153.1 MFS transporter [Pseudoduganella umbonata]